jgi:hypothetical protein
LGDTASGSIWIVDSCSLFNVRRHHERSVQRRIWTALGVIARNGRIKWPPEVTLEVERGQDDDPALSWVRQYRGRCEQAAEFTTVKAVLQVASSLIDSNIEHEQADPYVLALALDLQDLVTYPTVVTDDRVDKMLRGERKVSLATAAGMHGIPVVPLHAFLAMENIKLEESR